MALTLINVGTTANDGTGDTVRAAFQLCNAAMDEIDANTTKLATIETNADVTDAANVGASIHGATAKTIPVDADTLPLIDSAASNALKKVTWANVKATLKSYTDSFYIPLAGGTLTGALTLPNGILTGLSLTGSQATNTLDLSTTWNTSGNPALIYGRVTNTASGSTAKFFDFGTAAGGSLLFASKSGALSAISGVRVGDDLQIFSNWTSGEPSYSFRSCMFGGSIGGVLPSDRTFAWSSVGWGGAGDCYSNRDLILARDATGVLAQRNSTNAQTSRVYGTYTDASNYVRASLASSSTLVTLAAETAGTGADNIDINLTTAGTGLVNLATQSASADAAVASTHTARIKIGGVEYKILLATP